MPLYDYLCQKCGHRFEKIQKFSDKIVTKCPKCGGRVERVISAPAVQFKGSGWYVTDYSSKAQASGSDGGKDSKSADTSKTDSASKESSAKESTGKENSAKESSSKEPAKASQSKKADKRK